MGEAIGVSYSEWLECVKTVRKSGLHCEAFRKLQQCYPIRAGSSFQAMVHNELAGLETVLLRNGIQRFQSSVNQSIQEADLEIAEKATREFKKNIRACYFFLSVSGYPEAVREELSEKIEQNLFQFLDEYARFVRRMAENDNSCFAQEFEYLFKKRNLRKFIRECKANG